MIDVLTFGSLFAGIGGFDLGLEQAGMECRWQVDIDPFCLRVLEKHWPDVRRFEDVRECGKHNLETVDLIAGGFPCQPHSVAGKRKGAADDRNLWPEFLRIIRELRPTWIIAENVPGIITTYLDTVLANLESENYTCWTFNIPACAFNAPHRRGRIFIVAYSNKQLSQESVAECQSQKESGFIPFGEFDLRGNWLNDQSNFCRTLDGVPSQMDRRRIGVLGNAVVPQIAQWIGEQILITDSKQK